MCFLLLATGYAADDGEPINESHDSVESNNDNDVLYILLNKNHLTPGRLKM